MNNNGHFAEEARDDQALEEDIALTGPAGDPMTIESRVGEEAEEAVVDYPPDPRRGMAPRDGADGVSEEAIFEEENRDMGELEDELSVENGVVPDLFELGRHQAGESRFDAEAPDIEP